MFPGSGSRAIGISGIGAHELQRRAFPASARGLVAYELAMYTALCDAIYHFRFDYNRTQVI